jgi:hypothetical protein
MLNDILTGKASLETPAEDDKSGPYRVAEVAACETCKQPTANAELVQGLCPACMAQRPDRFAQMRQDEAQLQWMRAEADKHAQQMERLRNPGPNPVWLIVRIILAIATIAIAASR